MRNAHAQKRAAPLSELSETLEDYLKIILDLASRHDTVRVRDIARAKAVSMPTVVIALHRLAEKGLVRYDAHGPAQLTAAGMGRARQLAGRHAFLARFLREILGLPIETAAGDACGLEHHLTLATLERFVAFVECVESCPQAAHACRTASVQRTPAGPASLHPAPVPLVDLPQGASGRIAQLSSPVRERAECIARGLLPGVRIEVIRPGGPRRATRVRVSGQAMQLKPEQARRIFVELDELEADEGLPHAGA
jgi:DtxR family Mn-dependent transcriptional regulator